MPRSSQMPAREIRREGTSDVAHDYEKVKLLFDYTKYHIGIYTTLGTILIGVLGLHSGFNDKSPLQIPWVIYLGKYRIHRDSRNGRRYHSQYPS